MLPAGHHLRGCQRGRIGVFQLENRIGNLGHDPCVLRVVRQLNMIADMQFRRLCRFICLWFVNLRCFRFDKLCRDLLILLLCVCRNRQRHDVTVDFAGETDLPCRKLLRDLHCRFRIMRVIGLALDVFERCIADDLPVAVAERQGKQICFPFTEEVRQLTESESVYKMCCAFAVLIPHDNIADRQRIGVEIRGMIFVERVENAVKRCGISAEFAGINAGILRSGNADAQLLQCLIILKADALRIGCFLQAVDFKCAVCAGCYGTVILVHQRLPVTGRNVTAQVFLRLPHLCCRGDVRRCGVIAGQLRRFRSAVRLLNLPDALTIGFPETGTDALHFFDGVAFIEKGMQRLRGHAAFIQRKQRRSLFRVIICIAECFIKRNLPPCRITVLNHVEQNPAAVKDPVRFALRDVFCREI